MIHFDFIEKNAINHGSYYLLSREHVDELYAQAGFTDDDEQVPNFLEIDGKDCLFTENFVERNGKEYEIVIVANGFRWEDVLVFDDEAE